MNDAARTMLRLEPGGLNIILNNVERDSCCRENNKTMEDVCNVRGRDKPLPNLPTRHLENIRPSVQRNQSINFSGKLRHSIIYARQHGLLQHGTERRVRWADWDAKPLVSKTIGAAIGRPDQSIQCQIDCASTRELDTMQNCLSDKLSPWDGQNSVELWRASTGCDRNRSEGNDGELAKGGRYQRFQCLWRNFLIKLRGTETVSDGSCSIDEEDQRSNLLSDSPYCAELEHDDCTHRTEGAADINQFWDRQYLPQVPGHDDDFWEHLYEVVAMTDPKQYALAPGTRT